MTDHPPDILAMIADPDIPPHEIARALWASWGYLPDDGSAWVRFHNDTVRNARLAYERAALGLTDDQEPITVYVVASEPDGWGAGGYPYGVFSTYEAAVAYNASQGDWYAITPFYLDAPDQTPPEPR